LVGLKCVTSDFFGTLADRAHDRTRASTICKKRELDSLDRSS